MTDTCEKEKCGNCKFWKGTEELWGKCRKESPKLGGTSENAYTTWPATKLDDWCGEFEEKKT